MNTPWQFLLQTEDSSDWSPLSVTEPLTENRYRLAVKNAPPNLEVDIVFTRITDGSSYLLPRKQRYTRQVNAQGFLQLSPLTHLEPGIWQIRCSPSVMAEMSGQRGQASLEFTVTPAIELTPHSLSEASQAFSEEPKTLAEEPKTFSKPLLELQLPELLPLPELSLSSHHCYDMSEEEIASLTPELEAISHFHYDHLNTVIQPLITESELEELFSESASPTEEITINDISEIPLGTPEETQEMSPLAVEIAPMLTEAVSENLPDFPADPKLNIETELMVSEPPVLAISEPTAEPLAQSGTIKQEKNYLVQVHYLDSNTSITIDVAVLEDPDQPPYYLDLPNPAQMPRRLQLPLLAQKQVLPPKLSPAPARSKSSIRFTKLEPYQQAS